MDEDGDSQQFWLHSVSNGASTIRKSSSNFSYSTIFMMIVAIPVLLILHYAFSSFQSSTSQILKPNSVRKSWDSINVLLVLFAIVCGIFARWNENDDVESNPSKNLEIPTEEVLDDIQLQQASSSPTSSYELRWYELLYEPQMRTAPSSGGGFRRNSSSYPDLRQQSDWETTGEHRFKYYDDFEISRFNRSLEMQSDGIVHRGITRRNEDPDAKVIHVDTYHSQPNSSPKSAPIQNNPPSHSPPPPPTTHQNKIRVHQSVPKRERPRIKNAPPPPRASVQKQPQKEDKGSSSSNPIKTGLTPQTKLQRRKVRSNVPRKLNTNTNIAYESSSNLPPPSPLHLNIPTEEKYPEPSTPFISPSPPEPKSSNTVQRQEIPPSAETKAAEISFLSPSPSPPPMPIQQHENQKPAKKEKKKNSAKKEIAMVWASIYKRKKKQNQPQQLHRSDSDNYNGISQLFTESDSKHTSPPQPFPPPSPAPPPPPPPPQHSVFHSLFKKSTIYKTKKIHSTPPPPLSNPSGKPPLPNRLSPITNTRAEYVTNNSGSESPMFEIPRPPPPPPFRVPVTKFVVRGGYARIKSNASSRSGSPERLGFQETLIEEEEVKGETASYCASPDVNAKAETFIARLRGEWKLEKMNSVNED